MQNEDDLDEANTTEETRNGQRARQVKDRCEFEENNARQCDQTATKSSKDDTSCTTAQHDTVLKRFKKKILRKSSRNRAEEARKMSSREDGSKDRAESFEEDDYFEGHIYEVPFSNGSVQNDSGEATNMPNNGCRENGQCIKQNLGRTAQRNTMKNQRYCDINKVFQNGGPVRSDVSGSSRVPERAVNGLVSSRKERFLQGKSMSLPAPRQWGPVPLPGLASGLASSKVLCDTSSEDSSSEDWVQPPPRVDPRKLMSVRSQSLPSPSKLNLNYQFLNGLNDLCKCGWYWGPLSSKEAEVKLDGKPDGSFLVRDSNDNRYLLSLSFRSAQKTLHTRIEFCKGKFSFYAAPFISTGSFASVVELIDDCVETSKERVYCYTKGRSVNGATFPVQLTKPLSRFEYVCTLQHLCRFVIRQHFTLENIGGMPLPGIMKRYLGKNHFDAKPDE